MDSQEQRMIFWKYFLTPTLNQNREKIITADICMIYHVNLTKEEKHGVINSSFNRYTYKG